MSNKISSGEINYKYFLGYLCYDYKIKPLNIMLLKTTTCIKSYDGETKSMYFLIEDDELLKNYNIIWDKISANIKKEFDTKPIYNTTFLKTKIKSYGDEPTDFHDKEMPKADWKRKKLLSPSVFKRMQIHRKKVKKSDWTYYWGFTKKNGEKKGNKKTRNEKKRVWCIFENVFSNFN